MPRARSANYSVRGSRSEVVWYIPLRRVLVAAVAGISLAFTAAAHAGPLTWASEQVVDPAKTILSIDCPATTLCVATDGSGNVIASATPAAGASTWTLTSVNAGVVIESVSCPTTTLCLVSDAAGNIWWSTDPASLTPTWTSANIAGAVTLKSVECPTTTLCLAGGLNNGTIYSSTNPTGGAGAWQPLVVDAGREIASLECPSVTLCLAGEDSTANPPGPAVRWAANPTTTVASDWTKIDNFDIDPTFGGSVMEGISCPTVSFCVGSDDLGNVTPSTKPNGVTSDWAANQIASFTAMFSVSCPTTTLCVTPAGNTVYSSTDPAGGVGTWGSDLFNGSSLGAVSCATAGFCAVAGRDLSNDGAVYIGTQSALTVSVAGSGSGSVTGNGIACPATCSLFYSQNTPVSLTATPATGSVFSGWSGDCTGTATCDLTMATDRAVTATFDPAPPPATTASAAPANPPPVTSSSLPPPVQSQTANAYPTSGAVRVRAAGSKAFVPLVAPSQIRFGSIVDATHGAVQLVIANGHGGVDSGTFSEGQFKIVQSGAIVELDLFGGNFNGCPKAAKGGASAAAPPRPGFTAATVKRGRSVRHLWGNATGNFRTKGRFASATIRGTRWLTDDRCFGTLIRVAKGAVTVRDLVKRKSLPLQAPKSYFAAA